MRWNTCCLGFVFITNGSGKDVENNHFCKLIKLTIYDKFQLLTIYIYILNIPFPDHRELKKKKTLVIYVLKKVQKY